MDVKKEGPGPCADCKRDRGYRYNGRCGECSAFELARLIQTLRMLDHDVMGLMPDTRSLIRKELARAEMK
jgi:hypothetical protein